MILFAMHVKRAERQKLKESANGNADAHAIWRVKANVINAVLECEMGLSDVLAMKRGRANEKRHESAAMNL